MQAALERKNIINWKSYLNSTENIFLIKGNAGVGKSTFMYMNAKNEDEEISMLKFLISPTNLTGTLIEYLEKQFLCQPNQLEILFEHFNNLLKKGNNYLIIFIDAINELGEEKAKNIKNEIEDFLKVQWENIKIVYSCRTYFWKNCLQSSHSNENYFNIEEIKYFTNEELEEAFAKYKKVFNLVGDFKEGLTSDFKEKLKDPLMLRLLSEGYSNKGINIDSQEIRKIPDFAPAVEIFTEYVKLLNSRYPYDDIEKCLIKIGNLYWEKYNKVLGTMSMNFTLFEDLNQDTIKYLKDSNVIYEEDRCIQFSYERLFEFILGLSLVVKENWESYLQKITAQRIFEIWKESIDTNKPYTFNFALKSALIYLSRKSNYDEKNLIKNPFLLNELLHIQDTILSQNIDTTTAKEFRTFTLEILKELLSEGESKEKGYEQLKNNLGDEKFFDIILEIGRDDLRTIKYQVELLVHGSEEQRRQITINLLKLCNSEESINLLKESIINSFKETDEESLKGLVYLVPIFINFNKMGISPFEVVKEVILKLIKNFNFLKIKRFRDNLLKALKYVYENEGKYFFGVARGFNGIDYTWKMRNEEKDLAYSLVCLFSVKNIPIISEQTKKCIRFFASEIRYFEDIDRPYSENANIEKIRSWEYFIAKYVVMKFSEKNFNKAVELLDYLLKKNTWLTYDFVLTTMEFMLRNIHINNKENYDLGLLKMEEWVKLGENEFNEFFFSRLSSEDPLNISFNPLSQIANTMAEKDHKSSFKFLDSYINSKDLKKAKMALLSLRKVARRFPIAGKKSLVNAWNRKVNFDEEYISWLNQFIKELSYVHPKMVYELLNDVNATNEERNKIMNIEITSRTNEYNINIFFLWLLEDDNAMNYIVDLYYKMLESNQDYFFNNEFLEWIKSHV